MNTGDVVYCRLDTARVKRLYIVVDETIKFSLKKPRVRVHCPKTGREYYFLVNDLKHLKYGLGGING